MNKHLKDALIELSKFNKPSIPFKFDKLIEDNILGSKIHGTPYWEKDGKIPLNTRGEPMELMAQINLSKMPQLEHFPKDGIVQFFLSMGDTWGMNFDKPIDSKYNKVIYWPNPSMENYSPYPEIQIIDSPSNIPLSIDPEEIKIEACGIADQYHYDQFLENTFKSKFPKLNADELFDAICDEDTDELVFENSGSKIGGFAYFTQDDPRNSNELNQAWGLKDEDKEEIIVLLQLDSDHEEMMWGDCGVANWHILRKDLEKLDFSKVYFTWDCC